MDFIQTSNKQVDKFGPGKHGFSAGNPAGGVPATYFSPEWSDAVQQELINIVEGAGVVPTAAVLTQVRQAIRRMSGGNVTTVTFALSPFALTADHAGLVLVDATAGNVAINFPAANIFAALPYRLKRVDATANTVTLNRAGADTFDGATSVTLVGQDSVVNLIGDGVSKWQTLATPRGLARFIANGTFVVPPGVTTIYVSGVAGGGGGGGGAGGTSAISAGGGGGGAGQSIIRSPYSVTPGQSIAITIGAGGAGATGAGGAGGNTVIGALITLAAGGGGGGGVNAASPAGGASGSGYPPGSYGADGAAFSYGGIGASSPFGGGGGAGRGSSGGGVNGIAAGGFGAGGGGGGGYYISGAGAGSTGSAGSAGFVAIEW